MASPQSQSLRPHDLGSHVFVLPTWCDVCAGVLVGSGFECAGPCGLRCHAGLGKDSEHCRAELLLQPCRAGAEHKKGSYELGDATKQAFRNAHQRVKDVVVQEALKEQKALGKFDMLKQQAHQVKALWSRSRALKVVVAVQVASIAATAAISYALARLCSSTDMASTLARAQMCWSVVLILLDEILLILLGRALAAGMLRYSALAHTFVRDILHIDLEEVDISLDHAAEEVLHVLNRALCASAGALVAAGSAWAKSLHNF